MEHAERPAASEAACVDREREEGSACASCRCGRHLWICPSPRPTGKKHDQAKPLTGFGSAGVLEVIEDWRGNTYRAVYTVRLAAAVFVLHVFQKKSKRGIATPKQDLDLIKDRLKLAEQIAKELPK
jgi:hypothetical protein